MTINISITTSISKLVGHIK